jgi:hypothetical protein
MSHSFQYLDPDRAALYLGEPSSVMDMLVRLDQTLSHELTQLDALVTSGDVAAANSLLHQIKGYTPVFCTPSLTGPVSHIEALSKHCSAHVLQDNYRSVAPVLQAFAQEVRQCIQSYPADST